MNEIITHATVLINEMLDQSDKYIQHPDEEYKLIAFRDCLNTLFDYDQTTTDWGRLLFRRLTRLINYNKIIPSFIWCGMHDDMLYVLNKKNPAKDPYNNNTYFFKKMELEGKLEQRETQLKQIYGERKSLDKLVLVHRDFLGEYLQTCVSFHSTLQVLGLIENLNDLLYTSFQQKNITLTTQDKERLQTRLKNIEIPLECSHRSLEILRSTFSSSAKSQETDDASEDPFFPWIKQLQYQKDSVKKVIQDCLNDHRWLIILGDPGSAKTTLLRWIMRIFAQAVLRGNERVLIEGIDCGPVRIPILIRIGEFVQWREEHQTSTLMDYIGEHTWLSQPYSSKDNGNILKEFIVHGHTLILLDGLDEISIFERRHEIVRIVQEFINQYVQSPDFFSVFDEIVDTETGCSEDNYDMQVPKMNGGNQIIVTSRIVGYYLHKLRGPLIMHFLLSPMDTKEKKEFAENWFRRVNYEMQRILKSEGIQTDSKNIDISQTRQQNFIDKVFRNGIEQLSSHLLTFSLICSFVFAMSDDFSLPERRIELYDLTVQSTMRIWTSRQSIISADIIIQLLNELAFYIHLNSSSGLIDEYDMKQLCYSSLKQQRLSNDHAKLRQYTNELVTLFDSSVGVVAERGLQVFSFVHLSFQEYFVARYFVKHFSIDEVTHRFLSFATNSRFREPLHLALGWISWKWPFVEYDALCSMLVTQSKDYVIPLGVLLLFDAVDDLKILPSNEVIFEALNNILDHPSHLIVTKYLENSLSKLHENIIVEWMHLSLLDEKRVCNFCRCLLNVFIQPKYGKPQQSNPKWVSSLICQQLWSFHIKSVSAKFIIDETLRQIASFHNKFHLISKGGLCQYLVSHNISASDIHPLILSVIIALCDGMHLVNETFDFWPNLTYQNPSILEPFIDYFNNTKESHATKVQKLIDHYNLTLRNSLHTDISNDIINSFIVLICLRGVSQPSVYNEFHGYQGLILALNRFKQILFHLRLSYSQASRWMKNAFSLFSNAERIINASPFQSDQSNRYPLAFSLALTAAWLRLDLWWILRNLKLNVPLECNVGGYFQSHITFSCFIKYFYVVSCDNNLIVETDLDRIVTGTYLFRTSQKEPFFLLFFVPKGLELLYYKLIIALNNSSDSLPFVVLLLQCLMFLESIDKHDTNFFTALSVLQPLFKEHGLENYALSFLWEDLFDDRDDIQTRQESFDQFDIYLTKSLETHIDEERKRIQTKEGEVQDIKVDLNYFVASISLARIFQTQYRIRNGQTRMEGVYKNISMDDSKEIYDAITNINDLTLRIIAFSIVLNLKDPFVFDSVESDALRQQIIPLLERLLPTLPLLVSTFLFVQCQSIHQMNSLAFNQFAQMIGKKLITVPSDEAAFQNHEAAYIALKRLHNSSLASFLSQFEKQTMHLADLFDLNSTIFHRYFVDTTSFDSMNTVLLSSMYLTELALDAQILNKHTNRNLPNIILPPEELEDLLSESNDIITLEVAIWITYSLKIFNEENIAEIANRVFRCCHIQANARSVIVKWLNYRTDGLQKSFAYYATLLLAKEGIFFPLSINRTNELYNINIDSKFSCIIRAFLELQSVDSVSLNHILISIIRGAHRSSLKSQAIISCNEIMALILQLEQDRLFANELDSNSFFIIIDGCSREVQDYLAEYMRRIISGQSLTHITAIEEYINVIVMWIIRHSHNESTDDDISNKLNECIFELFENQQFPRIQKKIAGSLKIIFDDDRSESAFKTKQTQTHIENLICSCLKSSDTCADDLLTTCLLAYGNCILFFRRKKDDGNISSEMHSLLRILFKTSSSPIISARAGLCLFACNSNVNHGSLLDWLNEEEKVTYMKAYDVLIQRMILNPSNWIMANTSMQRAHIRHNQQFINTSIHHLFTLMQTYPAELITKFVIEMYNDLQNESSNDNLIKQTPNYIDLAGEFIQNNSVIFCRTVQESFIGQQKFQRALYQASKRGDNQQFKDCLKIYASFGNITLDLIDMFCCTQFGDDDNRKFVWTKFKDLKKITSDREAIESLFTEIGSLSEHFLVTQLLVYLAENDMLSMCELHHQISSAINNRSYQYIENHRKKYEDLCEFLLNFSCIRSTIDTHEQPTEFLTDYEIDETFENVRWA
jgi:hypothetical protein